MSLRRVASLLLTCCLAACGGESDEGPLSLAGTEIAMIVPFPPTPESDPFYAEPQPMPDVPPGTILASRAVTFAPLGVPLPNPAWQLRYMSTDMRGRPQAAIATVVQPLVPALTGNKPLLSYHFFTDSPGLKCQPSHQVTGSHDSLEAHAEALEYIPEVLAFGWTLIFPDYQGPTATVGVGRLAAPIVLDGIRAAESFEPLGLSVETPVGMMGYSGGSIPTAWAAALQPDYAPELNIVGAAAGGTVTNPGLTFKGFEGTPQFSLAFGALISINRVFPQMLPDGLLSEKGVRAAESLKDGCDGRTTDGSLPPFGRLADYTTVDDPFGTPGIREALPQLVLPQPGEAPTAEMYLYHQTLDELVPVEETGKAVAAWCEAGSRVHFYRDVTATHTGGGATFIPSAYLFLLSRFGNSPAPLLPPGTQSCN